MTDSKKEKRDEKFPRLKKKRIKEVNTFFKQFDIKSPEPIPINNNKKNIRIPGIHIPFKKFSLLKYEGYIFETTDKTFYKK